MGVAVTRRGAVNIRLDDATELRTILEGRADRAVDDEACGTTAIAKAAALAAQEVGNARQALDLRRVGAERAEQNGKAPVTDDHVTTARARVQRGRVAKVIRDQTEYAQYMLEAIATLRTSGKVPAQSTGDPASVRAGGGVARRLTAVDAEAHPGSSFVPPHVGVPSTPRAEQEIERGAVRRV